MRTHVKVLGVLQLVAGSLWLLFAVGIGMGFSLLGAFVGSSGGQDAEFGGAVLGFLGAAAAGFFGIGGAIAIASGIGVMNFKPWARILSIICSAISLVQFPIGTALGVYGLWVLFSKETEVLFASGGSEPGN